MTPLRLSIEMLFVGVFCLVLFIPVHMVAMYTIGAASMTSHMWLFAQVALSSALFHALCEVSGLNQTYCESRVQ